MYISAWLVWVKSFIYFHSPNSIMQVWIEECLEKETVITIFTYPYTLHLEEVQSSFNRWEFRGKLKFLFMFSCCYNLFDQDYLVYLLIQAII